jgi:hypothetical protein
MVHVKVRYGTIPIPWLFALGMFVRRGVEMDRSVSSVITGAIKSTPSWPGGLNLQRGRMSGCVVTSTEGVSEARAGALVNCYSWLSQSIYLFHSKIICTVIPTRLYRCVSFGSRRCATQGPHRKWPSQHSRRLPHPTQKQRGTGSGRSSLVSLYCTRCVSVWEWTPGFNVSLVL